jgi:hypothetical protein
MKRDFENAAVVYIQVSPWIAAMAQLSDPSALTSNATYTSVSYDTFRTYLVYQIFYS